MTVRLLPSGGWPERDPPMTPVVPPPARLRSEGPPLIELSRLRLRGPRLDQHRLDQHRLDQNSTADELNLAVTRGELVVVTGPARSGRSALLNVLGLLDRPASGRYLLTGIDTGKLSDRDSAALRARQIGFVFQRRMLLPARSVLDNVMLPQRYTGGRRPQRVQAAMRCLDQVGMAAAAQLMTWQLSPDELARCAIARALVNQPSLLLCDDPTAGLDQEMAARIVGLLTRLHRQGRTLILATGDQLAAAYCSQAIRLGPKGRPVLT